VDDLDDEPKREEVSSGALAYETVDGLSLCDLATPTAALAADQPTILFVPLVLPYSNPSSTLSAGAYLLTSLTRCRIECPPPDNLFP